MLTEAEALARVQKALRAAHLDGLAAGLLRDAKDPAALLVTANDLLSLATSPEADDALCALRLVLRGYHVSPPTGAALPGGDPPPPPPPHG